MQQRYLLFVSGLLLDNPGTRLFVFSPVCQLLRQVLSRLRLRVRAAEKQTGVMSANSQGRSHVDKSKKSKQNNKNKHNRQGTFVNLMKII